MMPVRDCIPPTKRPGTMQSRTDFASESPTLISDNIVTGAARGLTIDDTAVIARTHTWTSPLCRYAAAPVPPPETRCHEARHLTRAPQLRSHPVVPGIDIDPLFQRIRGIDSTASQPAAPHARRPSRDDAGSARPSTNPSSRHSSPGRRPSLDAVDRPGPPPDHHRSQPEYSGMDPSAYVDPRMPLPQPPPAWSTAAVPPWSTSTRPLSDIRELTEPSLVEVSNRKDFGGSNLNNNAGNNVHRRPSLSRKPSVKTATRPDQKPIPSTTCTEEKRGRRSPVCSPGSPADRSSVYSLPPGSVPPRSSSQPRRQRSVSHPRGPGVSVGVGGGLGLAPPPPPPRGQGHTIPNRGKSRSPVREVAARLDPVSSDSSRRIPSRTFTRNPQPSDILEFPSHRHHRITVELQLAASLFVGGGSIEGSVRIVVDEADRIRHRKTLALARISVDLVGVEEMSGAKRAVFLNLATELVDSENPPPRSMVDSQKQASPVDPFWYLLPSVSTLPFILSLPLDVGPPPFQSKHARIRYVVCVTLLVRDTGKQYLVRSSQDVAVLSVYDRESDFVHCSYTVNFPNCSSACSREGAHVPAQSADGVGRAVHAARRRRRGDPGDGRPAPAGVGERDEHLRGRAHCQPQPQEHQEDRAAAGARHSLLQACKSRASRDVCLVD